ncbi:32839_t:CDS:2 [Racocetra persica]|uniref:32839_t:CDS:1 n=1 Tax=Racocetra persica TaxID=160502 RepID=A0ACA9MST2_9GLOM|nr:32839_t:CDS:2 [Racocetra persica]
MKLVLKDQEEKKSKENPRKSLLKDVLLGVKETKEKTILEGDLKLEGFYNLEELDCSNNQLTSLDLSENKKLRILYCNYNQLQSINFGDLRNIEVLHCRHNQLRELNLDLFSSLCDLNCSYNQLSDTKLFSRLPYPKKLINLNLSNNNFAINPEANNEGVEVHHLSFLTRFANLVYLDVGNNYDSKYAFHYVRNNFHGSLQPLWRLRKLKQLGIANTGINRVMVYRETDVKESKSQTLVRSNELSLRSAFVEELALTPEQELIDLKSQLAGHDPTKLVQLWQDFANLQQKMKVYFKRQLTINELAEKVSEELTKNNRIIQDLQTQLQALKKQQTEKDQGIYQQKIQLVQLEVELNKLSTEKQLLEKTNSQLELALHNQQDKTRQLTQENTNLSLQLKKPEREQLLASANQKLSEEAQYILESMLETQIEVMNDANNKSAQKRLARDKKALNKYNLTEEELQNLLVKKIELTQLEERLEA